MWFLLIWSVKIFVIKFLVARFLTYDPAQRVTSEDALRHDYFKEAPLPIDPAMFPTWPAKSELGHRKAAVASPKPPPGGHEYKQLVSMNCFSGLCNVCTVHSLISTLILLMWRKGWAYSIPIYIQQHATLHSLFISGNCSTCFRWYFHPSSGAHSTVSKASGICHTVTAICHYRGRVGIGLSVLWVAYATHSTLKQVPTLPR
jgi:serine/threonine protein kinase